MKRIKRRQKRQQFDLQMNEHSRHHPGVHTRPAVAAAAAAARYLRSAAAPRDILPDSRTPWRSDSQADAHTVAAAVAVAAVAAVVAAAAVAAAAGTAPLWATDPQGGSRGSACSITRCPPSVSGVCTPHP